MNNIEIGKVIDNANVQRDAIHVAVFPAVAAERLMPGQHVGLARLNEFGVSNAPIGIVDPFLKSEVSKAQRFWLFLYPNTVTSLRHEWTHPAFGEAGNSSQEWIAGFAARLGMRPDFLMNAATRWDESGDYTNMGENESYKDVDYNDWPIFWSHYEVVTGNKVADQAEFFSCSC